MAMRGGVLKPERYELPLIFLNLTSIMLLASPDFGSCVSQIIDKIERIVADARPKLMNYIKQFFIGLLLHAAA